MLANTSFHLIYSSWWALLFLVIVAAAALTFVLWKKRIGYLAFLFGAFAVLMTLCSFLTIKNDLQITNAICNQYPGNYREYWSIGIRIRDGESSMNWEWGHWPAAPDQTYHAGTSLGTSLQIFTGNEFTPAPPEHPYLNILGFIISRGKTPSAWDFGSKWILFASPVWFPIILSLIPVALWFSKSHKLRHRRQNNLCLNCGYDLRASTEKCPECATPIDSVASSQKSSDKILNATTPQQ